MYVYVHVQMAVTIVGVMEQYLRNKDNNNDIHSDAFKSLVWHEKSHGMELKIAHHRMFDNNRADKRAGNVAPGRPQAVLNRMKSNWSGLAGRCGDIVK